MGGFKLALDNYVPGSTITASSQNAAYPVTNLALFTDLDQPWLTTGVGVQTATVDLGSARAIGRVAIFDTNYASVIVQGHSANSWSAGVPTYNPSADAIALGVNLGNGRICRWLDLTQTLRWWRITIPSQATTDGAGYYRTGALALCGAVSSPPRDLRWGASLGHKEEPVRDVFTVSRRRQRSYMGTPLFSQAGKLQAVGEGAAAMRTQMAAWFALERAWKAKDVAVVTFIDSEPYHVHVMRSLAPILFQEDLPAERTYEFEEVA